MPTSGSFARVENPRVLFVDDDDISRFVYDRIASVYGLIADAAATGREALLLASRQRPDVIVLDLRLPDLGGFEVLERLRADPRTRAIPVILMSCDDSAEVQAAVRACGCEAHLVKPFRTEEVVELVRALAVRSCGAGPRASGVAEVERSA